MMGIKTDSGRRRLFALFAALALVVAACGGDEDGADTTAADTPDTTAADTPATTAADTPDTTEAMSDEPIGTVTIVAPANGSDVTGSTVTVQLEVAGFSIVIAGDMTPGTGHHHLFLDADVTSATEPIPTVPGSIVHMGDASAEFTFEDVPAGEHRLIAVVADGAHVPLQPFVVDTVVFTIR